MWNTFGQIQSLEFIGTGYTTAVVIRKHRNGAVVQGRIKDPFTGNIKIVAIKKPGHFHLFAAQFFLVFFPSAV
jgi:hypothetical protein